MRVIQVKGVVNGRTAFNSDQFDAIQEGDSTKFDKDSKRFPPALFVGLKSGASISASFLSPGERDAEFDRIVNELEGACKG